MNGTNVMFLFSEIHEKAQIIKLAENQEKLRDQPDILIQSYVQKAELAKYLESIIKLLK
jgi:hypothetical protein